MKRWNSSSWSDPNVDINILENWVIWKLKSIPHLLVQRLYNNWEQWHRPSTLAPVLIADAEPGTQGRAECIPGKLQKGTYRNIRVRNFIKKRLGTHHFLIPTIIGITCTLFHGKRPIGEHTRQIWKTIPSWTSYVKIAYVHFFTASILAPPLMIVGRRLQTTSSKKFSSSIGSIVMICCELGRGGGVGKTFCGYLRSTMKQRIPFQVE